MAFADAATLFKATCKAINESYLRLCSDTGDIIEVNDELGNALAQLDTRGRADMQARIARVRESARAITAQWPGMMDRALAFMGTQLTVPSRHVTGTRAGSRRMLLEDIRDYMIGANQSIKPRAVTYAAEPSADDNGIIDRLTVDENGSAIEAGLHNQTLDVLVDSIPSLWRSIVAIRPRTRGDDIFNLQGPPGQLLLEAVNDVHAGDGIVQNPMLGDANTSVSAEAVTTLNAWRLTSPVGTPTHQWDTSILYRSNLGSHKIFGTTATRRFEQDLIVRPEHRKVPRNYLPVINKTGSPTGNVVLTVGSKSQTWAMAALSAGMNYLRLDRDMDLWPKKWAAAGMVLRLDIECTTGDASNYVNVCALPGQNYRKFDSVYYGHWSRHGKAALNAAKAFADTMTAAGKNATALYLAYHATADREYAYLPSVGGDAHTILDYDEPPP